MAGYATENALYADILCGHLYGMVQRARQIPLHQWDLAPLSPAAPTTRILVLHAWQWLVCDRQHITEPDVTRHALVPDLGDDTAAICDALHAEAKEWYRLILSLTPEQLDAPRSQFGDGDNNVRWFIGHMIQNAIYKHGQMTAIYFGLGLDGTEPYTAPFPNPFYKEIVGL